MLRNKYIFTCLLGFCLFSSLTSCKDDIDLTWPEQQEQDKDLSFLKGVPEDMLEGYTISFRLSVDPMGGEAMGLNSRADEMEANERLRYIENFVDLEKLRVLFFTCLDDDDPYGVSDIFLFESKSRWVSLLSATESTSANWMVTSPVFTYGNTEDYDWEKVQEILRTRPFKVCILANRPDKIRYSDFDTLGASDEKEFSFPNDGPKWGRAESEQAIKDYEEAKKRGFKNLVNPTAESGYTKYQFKGTSVNGLHHCQWDPVYAYKNSKKQNADGHHFYDFILLNPDHDNLTNRDKNWMGACSYWTHWQLKPGSKDEYYDDGSEKKTKLNWYTWPNEEQGIPMYGIQKFNALTNWLEGTPFNISDRQVGDDGNFVRKNIHLLRSLARIDLIVPKNLGEVIVDRTTNNAATCLMYSNVFGRCEPMDVATPTEEIWASNHSDNGDINTRCEFWNIYKYGPIVNGTIKDPATYDAFHERMAWFYGHWQKWGWKFDNAGSTLKSGDAKFDKVAKERNGTAGLPYPRIFNPCVQRNQYAYLDQVMFTTDDEYHFVIYTGERSINDPNKFDKLNPSNGELANFILVIKITGESSPRIYSIPLSNLSNNKNGIANSQLANKLGYMTDKVYSIPTAYKSAMASSNTQSDWNWPIMRNHVYTFRVLKIGGKTDQAGIDGLVIATEDRSTPFIDFY